MNSAAASRQDSPMVDEMFDGPGGGMEVDAATAAAAAAGSGGVAAAMQGVGTPGTNEDHGNASNNANNSSNASSALMSDLTNSDRTVHADFKSNFGIDFFDDDDLQ